jgi:hypothetical protein
MLVLLSPNKLLINFQMAFLKSIVLGAAQTVSANLVGLWSRPALKNEALPNLGFVLTW